MFVSPARDLCPTHCMLGYRLWVFATLKLVENRRKIIIIKSNKNLAFCTDLNWMHTLRLKLQFIMFFWGFLDVCLKMSKDDFFTYIAL